MKTPEHPLFEKYPQLFREKDLPASQTCMCWGITCGSGWGKILEDLCAKLHKLFTDAGLEGDNYPSVGQVKEKFGTLRFYMNQMPESVSEKAYEFISEAENLSAITCDICGAPGKTRNRSWVVVLCDDHARPKVIDGTSWDTIWRFGEAHEKGWDDWLLKARMQFNGDYPATYDEKAEPPTVQFMDTTIQVKKEDQRNIALLLNIGVMAILEADKPKETHV